MMKSNAVLINTSRGNVVNEEALLAKLEANDDFWVGTDVFNGEPAAKEAEFNHPIAAHPRVYGTHHCGASTQQAEAAIGQETVRIIGKFSGEGRVDKGNWVNSASLSDSNMHKLQIRHLDKVGVLAHCFKIVGEAGWNIQELENIVFKERQACVANIMFEGDLANKEEIEKTLSEHDDVLSVSIS